nr:hypothetical protein [uncultured Campylobacter sp.]
MLKLRSSRCSILNFTIRVSRVWVPLLLNFTASLKFNAAQDTPLANFAAGAVV